MDVITTQGVTKTYRIGVGSARVREALPWPLDLGVSRLFPGWWMRNTFSALDNVTMAIPAGSSVGIVGHNGAGKTTLLKVISGVTHPTQGKVSIQGRVGALLDVVMGFHPELTGRENAYLLGSIYGLGRKAMAKRIEGIIEFAGIDDLADTPIKRYSSGMIARLGFSAMTAFDIDVLLVDEVLAVGDSNFQNKCIGWLDEFRARGGTLLFVSHNLSLVRHMTERVLWLDHGQVVGEGETEPMLAEYAKGMGVRDLDQHRGSRARGIPKGVRGRGLNRWGAGGARIEEVQFSDSVGAEGILDVTIRYEATEVDEGFFCVGFLDEAEREIGATASPLQALARNGVVRCRINLPLRPGIYFPVTAILSPDGQIRDRWRLDRAVVIERTSDGAVSGFGPVEIDASWSGPVSSEEPSYDAAVLHVADGARGA